MIAFAKRHQGLALVFDLNFDRLIYAIAIIGGLSLGSYVGTFALNAFH